jgi:hypothetical protein
MVGIQPARRQPQNPLGRPRVDLPAPKKDLPAANRVGHVGFLHESLDFRGSEMEIVSDLFDGKDSMGHRNRQS